MSLAITNRLTRMEDYCYINAVTFLSLKLILIEEAPHYASHHIVHTTSWQEIQKIQARPQKLSTQSFLNSEK